ncbi:hypothetical protein BVG81_003455 [Haliangium sp. UPWRP_2]|nr:hypothetical protein BVG81_003455 [Haliangium sp. UPWRP_2]
MGQLVFFGLDVGSTTCHAVVAAAQVRASCATGRMELCRGQLIYRSQPVFTPFVGSDLDCDHLGALIDGWLSEAGIAPEQLAGGGAIVTGLAAAATSAQAVRALVRERISSVLIATAQDPHLESWLAFMGSCDELSQTHPERLILNLDIGGGTSNLALGRSGSVLATDVRDIGARHLRFIPGTTRHLSLDRNFSHWERAACKPANSQRNRSRALGFRSCCAVPGRGCGARRSGFTTHRSSSAGRCGDRVFWGCRRADLSAESARRRTRTVWPDSVW